MTSDSGERVRAQKDGTTMLGLAVRMPGVGRMDGLRCTARCGCSAKRQVLECGVNARGLASENVVVAASAREVFEQFDAETLGLLLQAACIDPHFFNIRQTARSVMERVGDPPADGVRCKKLDQATMQVSRLGLDNLRTIGGKASAPCRERACDHGPSRHVTPAGGGVVRTMAGSKASERNSAGNDASGAGVVALDGHTQVSVQARSDPQAALSGQASRYMDKFGFHKRQGVPPFRGAVTAPSRAPARAPARARPLIMSKYGALAVGRTRAVP